MADNKKMSVEDILAACRSVDGGEEASGGGGASPQPEAGEPAAAAEAAAKPAASSKPAGEMSVADIMAAARQADSDGAGAESTDVDEAPEAAPAAAQGDTSKKASDMSVADVLAAARGGGGSAAPAKKKAPAKAKASKAAKPAAKPAAKQPAGPMDTSSILAAARKAAKPGPMSKSEAAAKGKSVGVKDKTKPSAPPMPEKPAYAVAKAKVDTKAEENRRGFMGLLLGSSLAIGWTSLSLTTILSTLGLARFIFPNILIEPPSRFKVGFPSDFAPGSVETKFKAQYGVWIVNAAYEGEPQIVALKTVCTHLGCTPNWLEAEQKFKCPCHGSGFYKEGINFEGPAPRPLERYAIRVADDGQLEIDKSKTFQQEMGQWSDSASFVPT